MLLDLSGPIRQKMTDVLDEIRSGGFAKEWSGAQEKAGALLEHVRAARENLPLAAWERRARAAFRIGDQGA